MLDSVEVLAKEFEESHLFSKLRKQVVVSRIFQDVHETSAILHAAAEFDLDNPHILAQVKADYETVCAALRDGGFSIINRKHGRFGSAAHQRRGTRQHIARILRAHDFRRAHFEHRGLVGNAGCRA